MSASVCVRLKIMSKQRVDKDENNNCAGGKNNVIKSILEAIHVMGFYKRICAAALVIK